ncbi:hypothetical protein DPMN_023403 [Dreissena polymorpha]|uniref:Fibrinogen C-terminal domain-containing protein n=2 Tax=Dreissena polymorpha TaxID=45954 RepID=A0A9D4RAP4_DREPO|nr:hypothetical protein DPMN_023403 [Dreissena polymorpha]
MCVLVPLYSCFLENPGSSPPVTATTTSYQGYDGHCTCNVNVRDVPTSSLFPSSTSSATCTPDEAMKLKLQQLEAIVNNKIQDILTDNSALKQQVAALQQQVTQVQGISSELQCARATAVSIGNDVTNLLNHVLISNSTIQQRHCIPVIMFSVNGSNTSLPRDCLEVYARNHTRPGLYEVQPDQSPVTFKAWCEDGWTVLQRHIDNSVDFASKYWDDYLMGFSDPRNSNFWLGLEHMHYISAQNNYTLRINMTGYTGKQYWAQYEDFTVDSEVNNFSLTVSNYTGNYKDGFANSTGDFETGDHGHSNCIDKTSGGWWVVRCVPFDTNLNNMIPMTSQQTRICLRWAGRCMSSSVMKIIPTSSLSYL